MGNNFKIGTRLLASFPINDGKVKRIPSLIWGRYLDSNGCVIGLDVLPMNIDTTERLGNLKVSRSDFKNTNRNTQNCRIETTTLASLSIDDFDVWHDTSETLKSKFFPDLIVRRAQSLTSNTLSQYRCTLDFSKVALRQGIQFANITPEMAGSGISATDVAAHDLTKHVKAEIPDEIDLTQGDIDAIAKWAMCRRTQARAEGIRMEHIWPKSGTWPNWPDTVDSFGNVVSCSAQKTKIEAQTPTTEISTRPTAAQLRLRQLGGFTLK